MTNRKRGGGNIHQDSPAQADKYGELAGKCRAQIHQKLGSALPELVFVLGSGFQDVIGAFQVERTVRFSDLPGFPAPKVRGHAGLLARATLRNLPCLICCGRAHYYEGHSMEQITFPVRALAACGIRELLLTNAAGGIDQTFSPGDLMLLADHINFMGANPLRGLNCEERFVDLSCAYSPALRNELRSAAARAKVRLHEGVYLAVSGPSYETPAEIKAFARLGAHAVGMSTVPEVLMARAFGVEVAAISCITNPAAGLKKQELSHAEVLRTGRASAQAAASLFAEFAMGRINKASSRKINLKKGSRILGSEAETR